MIPGKQRLGIYGGTFSPPHIGHVRAALDFLHQAELDRLLIMPAGIPPHKQLDSREDPRLRLAMAHAAFSELDKRIIVSDFEIEKTDVSYTCETLAHFHSITDAELWLLCGTDMFLTLDRWRCPEQIFSLATVACVMRETDEIALAAIQDKETEYRARYGAKLFRIAAAPTEISSTQIREHLRQGEDVSGWISPAVLQVIRENNLYQE